MQKEFLVLDPAWQFKEFPESARRMRDLDDGDWLNATVPVSIYTCLNQAGIISIPDLHTNPEDLNWVDEKDWVFRKEFDVPPALLEKEQIEIIFDGLDTVTHIWLNEKLIGKTENMFILHRFDIKPYLKKTGNRLYIKFVSALHHADRLLHRYGNLGETHLHDRHRVYIRKAQYQFSSAPTGCGIFRKVRIEGHNIAKIENLHLRTIDCNQHNADIRVALELNRINKTGDPLRCKIIVTGGGLELEHELLLEYGNDTASTILHIDRPFLWWPQGYGVPHMYHVKTELLTNDGQVLDTVCQDFGVRTIRIEKTTEKTEFLINDQLIQIKGADWMPVSLFPGTANKGDYEQLLKRAKECNINMLRVWAGGYYQDSVFYELCDRMGILVWQDFMFDSAYYPDRQWFTDSVRVEAETIIRQLRNHACIALWCGNNNIDRFHENGKLGKGRKFYGKAIFHKLLPKLVGELDPDREYIPTHSIANPEKQILIYHTPDIPSPPCLNTLSTRTHYKDSLRMLDKLTGSYSTLQKIAQCQVYEFLPPKNLKEYIWQSQVVQARRTQNAVEEARSGNHSGGSCMLGAFNDFALAISPSMFDAQRQPKALFYYAQRFFAPILVAMCPEDKTGLLKAYVINDTAFPVTGVLSCRMIAAGGETLDATEIPLRVSPFSKATAINLPKSLSKPEDPTRAFLSVCIKNNDKTIAENTYFFCRDKQFKWAVADIDLQIGLNNENNAWNVTLTSEVPVRDLQIAPPQPADLSDNFLTLLPNEPKMIQALYEIFAPSTRVPINLYSVNQSVNTNF